MGSNFGLYNELDMSHFLSVEDTQYNSSDFM